MELCCYLYLNGYDVWFISYGTHSVGLRLYSDKWTEVGFTPVQIPPEAGSP